MKYRKLPPLPLVEGCLFIDNSTLERIITCTRSAEYLMLDNRISSGDRAALNYGTSMHLCLAHRYAKYDELITGPCEYECYSIIDKHFDEHPQPIDNFRQPGYAKMMIAEYLKKYNIESFSVVESEKGKLVEKPFAFRLGSLMVAGLGTITIIYCGRIDVVIHTEDDYWVMDHKTSIMMGKNFFLEQKRSAQWQGYCKGLIETTGIKPKGAIINALRTSNPGKPDGTQKKRAPVIEDDFERFRFELEDHMLPEWEENTLKIIDNFLHQYADGYLPMETKWCIGKYGACPYYEVCDLPPESRIEMLTGTGLYKNNDWSPLNQVKEKHDSSEQTEP